MGEDNTDNLQDKTNSLARTMTEMDYVEQGGTGSLDHGYGYDPDESPQPDIDNSVDFQDESADFTKYDGGDPYNQQFGQNNQQDDKSNQTNDGNGADNQLGNTNDNFDRDGGNYDNDAGNYDGTDKDKERSNSKDENGENPKDESTEDKSNGADKKSKDKQSGEGKKEKAYAKIPWQKGDKIDLKLLTQVWDELHKIKEVEPLINTANEALKELLLTMPDSMILTYVKAHDQFRQWSGSSRSDLIGTILDMVKSVGSRMTYTSISVAVAFFSQTWADPVAIATLPTVVDVVLANPVMQGALEAIFEKAVPLLEKMDTHK